MAERRTTRVSCFAPVAAADATVLILGSIPGEASLRAGQYYAHPRNLFWPILDNLVGAGPALPYRQRLRRLRQAGIALWDVLESCARPGSMDADIEHRSAVVNDFRSFFARHPLIERVYFNGTTAERCFRRHVLPLLQGHAIEYARLPSTSPAHASLSFERKLAAWHAILTGRRPKNRAASAAQAPGRARPGSAPSASPGPRSARGAPSPPGSR